MNNYSITVKEKLNSIIMDMSAHHWLFSNNPGHDFMRHSKKPEFLKQEIYANLILYNFGIFLANEAVEENRKKKRNSDNKYNYEIDFSSALRTARKFFIRKDSHKPVNIIKLMLKYVHAVKTEFRQFTRPLRGIGAIHFGYR